MNKNLVSLQKLVENSQNLKLLAALILPSKVEELTSIEKEALYLQEQVTKFNSHFSTHGWCAYDHIDCVLMEDAVTALEQKGLGAAERILLDYYKAEENCRPSWIKNSAEAFMMRGQLIHQFFKEHIAGRYHASVPLGLMIVDGAVNDFTRSKGLFASGTDLDAWDSVVGCSEGLSKLRDILVQSRTKTNSEEIRLPYRHGILHGRDLNYANEHVSCKCVMLMYAVADWMRMKSSEQSRRKEFNDREKPIDYATLIKTKFELEEAKKRLGEWKPRTLSPGPDFPVNGSPKDYENFPYLVPVVEMMNAWRARNYGKLSSYMRYMLTERESSKKMAGECRRIFETKEFISYKLVSVDEQTMAKTRVRLQIQWRSGGNVRNELVTFGIIYMSDSRVPSLPFRGDGEWMLMPWDTGELLL